MNFAAVALVGVTLGQPAAPPTPEYYPMNSRNIKIPIKYERDRKAIRQVKLYVAPKGENTWYQEAAVTPDREFFSYLAKEDGIYWFTMVEEDLQGKNTPADLTRTPPDLKVIVDTLQPRVQFTNAKRTGDEVVVEWFVDDKNPDESKSQVHFRPAGTDGYWQQVTLPASSKSGVRFPAGTTSPVSVRVTVYDIAGNKTEAVRDIGVNDANNTTSTSMSPVVPPVGPSAAPPATGGAGGMEATGGGAIAPPETGGPIAPPATGGPVAPPPATGMSTGGNTAAGTGTDALPGGVLPTVEPKQPIIPASPTGGTTGGPTPVAVWTGPTTPAGGPTIEVSRAQAINYLAFDLGYEVESRGPSGISRLDLWVTRDDGRTWLKWSQQDGKAASVRVNLGVPANPQREGTYGFRVVAVSGALLSEREPVTGDAPELRVVVDITPPQLTLLEPVGDPHNPDTLVIQWTATDKNFGEDPITIEWSDKPTGPWQPVAVGGDVVQVGAGNVAPARRLPNTGGMTPGATGSFKWRVPVGLPPRVHLKVAARDSAGNERTVITRDPILVDLVKPRAKISGIVAPAGGAVRP